MVDGRWWTVDGGRWADAPAVKSIQGGHIIQIKPLQGNLKGTGAFRRTGK